MDFKLSDEMTALRENAARFAREQVAPYAQEWETAGEYPDAMIRKLDEGKSEILRVLIARATLKKTGDRTIGRRARIT